MSNTITAARESINAWCEQVRQIHADATRPVQDDDPRQVELYLSDPSMWTPEKLAAVGFDADDLGELYFMKVCDLPAFPLPAPDWAVHTNVHAGAYPEVVVEYSGQQWEVGEFSAKIIQARTVYVDAYEGHRAGEHVTEPPTIETTLPKDGIANLTLEQAMNLSIALEDVAQQFAREVTE